MSNWLGVVISGLPFLFLLSDAVIKVLRLSVAVEPTVALGYRASAVMPIGLLEFVCLVLYAVPRTAVLGAVLLTGYLGGAVATQVRAATPSWQYVFPVIVGALLWTGLWLRDPRISAMLR